MLDINLTNIFNLANVDAQKVLDSLDDDDNDSQFSSTDSRKRKRLDDFTPQERIVRRKLKNRVAAQTARDRKKERMATLEQIVSRLELENSELKKSNNELRTNMDYLMSQNKELRMKLGMEDTITPEHNYTRKVTALPDPKHIIIKEEEEELKTEHAAETSSSFDFINHDMVSESQIEQPLIVIGEISSTACCKENVTTQVTIKTEREISENEQNCTNNSCSGSETTFGDLSPEDANEMFELCKDIESLVQEGNNSIADINFETNNFNSLTKNIVMDIPDELICNSISAHKDNKLIFDDDAFFNSSDLFMDDDFVLEKTDETNADLFTDLFPTLSTL